MDFDEVKRSFDRDCRIGVEPLLVSATVEIFDNRRNPGCGMTTPLPTEAHHTHLQFVCLIGIIRHRGFAQ